MKEKTFLEKIKEQLDGITSEYAIDVMGTVSAFLMALIIYAVFQGLDNGISFNTLINLKALIISFGGGIGIIAVQEDGMKKAIKVFSNMPLYKETKDQNIELSKEIINIDFKQNFVDSLNTKRLQETKLKLATQKIETLKKEIYNLEFALKLAKKIRNQSKLTKLINSKKSELDYLEKNGVDEFTIKFEYITIDEIFGFDREHIKLGQNEYKDRSSSRQRKQNILKRFYLPIIMLLIQGTTLAITNGSIWSVLLLLLTFLLMLIYAWFSSYTKQLELKKTETLPIEVKKNATLKQAHKEYNVLHPLPKESEVIE